MSLADITSGINRSNLGPAEADLDLKK